MPTESYRHDVMNFAVILFLSTACFQAPSSAPAATSTAAPAAAPKDEVADPLLGPPLVVDGKTIPQSEIKRYLALGVGSHQLDQAKFQFILEQELERRTAAGEDVSKYIPTDAELQKEIEKQREDFALKYPTLPFETEVGRAFLHFELWKLGARQTIVFDRLFVPENPDEWPEVTTEALLAEGGGTGWIDDARTSFEVRKKKMEDEGLPELPPDDPIWVDYLRSVVIEALNTYAQIEMRPDHLPLGVAATVEGKPITVDSIYQLVRPHITPDQVEDAKEFLALSVLLEKELAAKGALISRKEFEETFDGGKPWPETTHRYSMAALQVFGFPSMDAFFEHKRLTSSFKKTLAADLADDAKIMPLFAKTNAITAAAKADAEVILASAYDDDNVRWKADGWKQAEAKAKRLKQALDEGADWTKTLELESEFWDPPMPEAGPDKPQMGFRFKGRWGPKTRNEFMNYVNESEYRIYLDGGSVTDQVFFDQKVGTIAGPLRGARGYYIVKLKSTSPPSKMLDMKQASHRELVAEYYVKDKFNAWSQDLLKQAIAAKRVTGI